jgi:predicted DNA-binding protein
VNLERKMTVRLTESCYERLEAYSNQYGVQVGKVVRELIRKYLEQVDENSTENGVSLQT